MEDYVSAEDMHIEKGSDVRNPATTDEELLTQLGHVQELRREFSVWSLGSLCLCLMATWEALSSVVAAALTNGGAPCLFYNYLISFLGTIAVACSLGEIASIYPTAGGQYHWVASLAPYSSRAVASWFTGWISIGGQIVLTASAAFASGLQLQGLITLDHPDAYMPKRWQGMLFYWLVLGYSAAINIWGSKLLPTANLGAGLLHIAGFIVVVAVLGAMAPKHDAHYVFVEFSNTSGWSNNAISWLVGLLSTVYPFLGYDAACHLAEEMVNPRRNVPLAMVGSVLVNGILGLGYCVVLLFSLGDLNDLLASPSGFPFMQLFENVTRSRAGGTILSLVVSFVAVAANTAGLTSTSRTAWAFARDKAIPLDIYFAQVNSKAKVPVRMVICISVLQGLLGFLYLGSTTAFNAVLSMAILGMYASYLLPIIYMLLHRWNKSQVIPEGYFQLGRTGGYMANIVSVLWLIFAMIFSTFPSYEPVTAENMNYSTVVMFGWLAFGVVYFFTGGRGRYLEPSRKQSI